MGMYVPLGPGVQLFPQMRIQICASILGNEWSPVLSVISVCVTLQSMLASCKVRWTHVSFRATSWLFSICRRRNGESRPDHLYYLIADPGWFIALSITIVMFLMPRRIPSRLVSTMMVRSRLVENGETDKCLLDDTYVSPTYHSTDFLQLTHHYTECNILHL